MDNNFNMDFNLDDSNQNNGVENVSDINITPISNQGEQGNISEEPIISDSGSIVNNISVDNSNFNQNESNEENDNIDFSYFDGKVLELLGYHYLCAFITAFTFGVFKPWADCIFWKFKYSHTIYNGKRLKFDGDPEQLFVLYFRCIFFTIITLGIYLLWVPVRMKEWEMAHVHFEDEPLVEGDSYFTGSVLGLFGTNLLCAIITGISFGLLFPLAFCKRTKWFLNNSVISKQYVYFEGSAFKFFLKMLKWAFLTIITFGIYGFFVELRLTQWVVENTTLIKDEQTV